MYHKSIRDMICILIGVILFMILLAIIVSGCASSKPVEVYIPQKCQTEIPPKLDCSSVKPDEYEKITHCMIWNKKRQELLEARLRFCIGDDL